MTDIEIAQNAKLKKIGEIAESIGLTEDDFEPYGKYKAKVSLEVLKKNAGEKRWEIDFDDSCYSYASGGREVYCYCWIDAGVEQVWI